MVVEQKEPHAGRMAFADVEQPATFEARCTLAERIRDELEVPLPLYVDGMDDASRALFSDLPSPAFVIDREGRIADKLPWADPEPLRRSIETVLARAQVPPAVDGTRTLDERDAWARAALARGDADRARAWLEGEPTPTRAEGQDDRETESRGSQSPDAVARAAVARARALAKADASELAAQVRAARRAIDAAWQEDRARAVAALCELAAVAGADARATWRAALDALDARAPERVRSFLTQQAGAK